MVKVGEHPTFFPMSYYYKTDENLPEQAIKIKWQFQGQDFCFHSNRGIFSKDKIDKGSIYLLEYLLSLPLQGKLLDVGCGYGVLGIVAKSHYPDLAVTMVDINQRAVTATVSNCEQNNVEAQVFYSDLFSVISENFDMIISNPPIRAGKKVVQRLIEEAYEHLLPGGSLLLVIRKQQGALSWRQFIVNCFGNCEIIKGKQGYCLLRANRA